MYSFDICNLSLQEGIFPDELKIANVIPLFKSDDPELFNNYRQCRCYALCQRSLRKLCTTGCSAFSINTKFCFHINLDFGNIIPLIWV